MIDVRIYTIADLEERLQSGNFWTGDVVPITKHRALSQIRNPRARPNDVVLLVAYNDERVVGYIGVLPDSVFVSGEMRRIGWLTAWWANPDSKFAGIGLVLMAKALKIYGGAIGASGFSDAAKKVYESSKQFITITESVRMKLFVRANSYEFLPRKSPVLKNLGPLLRLLDFSLNIFCGLRLRLWKRRFGIGESCRLEYVAEVDSQTASFIGQLQGDELTKRGAAEINWIAQHPWVLASPIGTSDNGSFYFSSTARDSICLMVKVFSPEKAMIGFIMLRVINGHLTVPYCYMLENCADKILAVIGEHVVALQVHTVTVCRAELRDAIVRQSFPCVSRKSESRSWIIGNVFKAKLLEGLEMQDGDGDCAFC